MDEIKERAEMQLGVIEQLYSVEIQNKEGSESLHISELLGCRK